MYTLLGLMKRGIVTGVDVDEFLRLFLSAIGGCAAAVEEESAIRRHYGKLYFSDDWMKAYRREMEGVCSLPLAPDSSYAGRWQSLGLMMTPWEFRESGILQLGWRFGIGDWAVAKLTNPFRGFFQVTIFRDLLYPPFSKSELAFLDLLSPHIAEAFATKRAMAAIAEPGDEDLADLLRRVNGHAVFSFSPTRAENFSSGAKNLFEEKLGPLTKVGWAKVEEMTLAAVDRFMSSPLLGRSQVLTAGLRVEFAFLPAVADKKDTGRSLLIVFEDEDDGTEVLGYQSGWKGMPVEELLSPRQRHVARAAAVGLSVKQIAFRLEIAKETVRTHLKAVYRRLGISSRSELATVIGSRD